nr:hypothetical protein [Tanacetum cinerariifolium]
MSSFYKFIFYGCGGPSDAPVCYLCTCEQCKNILIHGTCLKCNSGAGNSFPCDLIPESFNEVQIIPNPPPQPYYNIYLCQICESNSHYGYEYSQRVPLVYEPEPCYNQNFSDNAYPHDSPGVTLLIDHHCYYKCGDSLNGFFCHQCTCEFCGKGAHDGYNCPSHVPFIQTLPNFPQQYPCCEDCGGPHETFQCQLMNYFESNPCYDSNYSGFDQIKPLQYSVNPSLNNQNKPDDHELFISKLIRQKLQNEYAQPFPAIAITFDLPTVETKYSLKIGDEHLDTNPAIESDEFIKSSVENLVPSPSEYEDLSESECDVPACDDFTTFSILLFDADDDLSSNDNESFSDEGILKEIYSNPLFNEEIISIKIDPHHFNAESDLIESLLNHDSSIISFSLKIDSLLDEFASELILLKSIPPGIDETDCDPEEENHLIEKLLYDNSSPHPPKGFISENSDAEIKSFSPSPIPVEDSDSFMEEIDLSFTPEDSMLPGIEEDDYDSERDMLIFEEFLSNDSLSLPENESFHFDIPSFLRPPAKPSDDDSRILTDSDSFMEEIDLSFTPEDPMLPGIEEDDYDSERAMLIFEEFLSNDSLSLPENESFHFDIPSFLRPPAKPSDDDSRILTVKMVDDISELYVPMLRLLPTQPTFVSNQEKSHDLLSHQGFKASQLPSECPMMIYEGNNPNLDVTFLHFYPLDQLKYGGIGSS